MTSPCLNCTARYIGCHANCNEYKDWSELLRKAAETRKQYFDNLPKYEDLSKRRFQRGR